MLRSKQVAAIALLGLVALSAGCKKSTDSKNNLIDSEGVKSVAQWIGFSGVSQNEGVKGVLTLGVQTTQDVDTTWAWSTQGLAGNTVYQLAGDNRSFTWVARQSQPTIATQSATTWSGPYKDGSYADQQARVDYHNKYTTAWDVQPYDKDGTAAYNTTTIATVSTKYKKTYAIAYDATTGLPATETITYPAIDGTYKGSSLSTDVYTYAASPWEELYYQTSRTYNDWSSTAVAKVGAVSIAKARDVSGTQTTDTYTVTCMNSTGVVAADWDSDGSVTDDCYRDGTSTFGYSGTTYGDTLKFVQTEVTDRADKTVTRTQSWQNGTSGNTVFYKDVRVDTYNDLNREWKASRSQKQYTVAGGVETLAYQQDNTYDAHGLETKRTIYSIAAGVATMSSTRTYTYDALENPLTENRYDAAGDETRRVAYSYDDLGRRSGAMTYDVAATVTSCNSKSAYSYSGENQGVRSFTNDTYGCTGTAFDTNATSRSVYTYNAAGQITMDQTYTGVGGVWTLSGQTGYSYGTGGEPLSTQFYSVTAAGVATATGKTSYTYDDNLFRNVTKFYDTAGALCTTSAGSVGSCTTACTAGAICYTTTTYTYQ